MSRALWIILAIVIGSVFGYGAHLAYGEVEYFEDVIRIPIPANTTGTEKKATMTAQTDTLLEFTIKYRFHIAGNYTDWKEQILLDGGITPPDVTLCPERFYLDEDGVTCYPISAKPPSPEFVEPKSKELTKYEEQLKWYQDNPPDTYDKMDEMRKLETLIECQRKQGIENTLGIQDERSFYISDYNGTATVPKTGDASAIDIAIEECIAQIQAQLLAGRGRPTLEGEFLSAQDFFERLQPYHQEMAIIPQGDWNNYAEIPTHGNYPSPKQQDFSESQQLMCNSQKVLPEYKQENGCSPEQIAIQCMAVECMDTKWNDTGVGGSLFQGYDIYRTSEGGGVLPIEGWNMTPESERTEEQHEKCSWTGEVLLPNAYLRAICGK